MNCPEEIADILVQILGRGVIYARAAGWSGDAKRAALEADHIHNLPDVLATDTDDKFKLWYYFHLERPSYMSQVERLPRADNFQIDTVAMFHPLWERLQPFVPQERPARPGKTLPQVAAEFAQRGQVEN